MALLVQTAAELREAHEARDEEISQAFHREMKRLEDLSSSSSLATEAGPQCMCPTLQRNSDRHRARRIPASDAPFSGSQRKR